jgi:hypothetical protein
VRKMEERVVEYKIFFLMKKEDVFADDGSSVLWGTALYIVISAFADLKFSKCGNRFDPEKMRLIYVNPCS